MLLGMGTVFVFLTLLVFDINHVSTGRKIRPCSTRRTEESRSSGAA